MKKLLLVLLALIIAVALGLFIKNHPGTTAFEIQGWAVEMPIWLALFGILVGFLIFYALLRGLFFLLGMKSRYRKQAKQKREIFLRFKTEQALLAMTVGEFEQAEHFLLEAAKKHPRPFIQYLSCAHAAQEQGEHGRAADYLLQAKKTAPEDSVAAEVAEAELLLLQNQPDAALITLKHLHRLEPKNQQILKLLAKTYGELGQWSNVLNLLPILSKKKLLSSDHSDALEIKVYQELLRTAVLAKDATILHKAWAQIPKTLQKDPAFIEIYAQGLLQQGEQKTVEALLRGRLKKQSYPNLLALYGQLNVDLHSQLGAAEGWLKGQEQNPALLLCLGRLCKQNQLWGKAKSYLELSAKLAPAPATFQELGEVLERLHDNVAAMAVYKQGLELSHTPS